MFTELWEGGVRSNKLRVQGGAQRGETQKVPVPLPPLWSEWWSEEVMEVRRPEECAVLLHGGRGSLESFFAKCVCEISVLGMLTARLR